MRDATRFAAQIAEACPLLRELRVIATALSIEYFWIDQSIPLSFSRSKWTVAIVQRSDWFTNIRPLSGLKKVTTVVTDIDFYNAFSLQDQTNVRWNIILFQSVFEQSATRAREEPREPTLYTPLLMEPIDDEYQNSETCVRLGVCVLCLDSLSSRLHCAD
jgi:hypothetical protein